MNNPHRSPWCSQCHKKSGDTRLVCHLETENYMGERSETYVQAAGVFCSAECLTAWLGRDGVLSTEVE